MVSPLHSQLGFVVSTVGLWFWLAPHHSWLGFWGVRDCVRAPPVACHSRFGCGVWVCVLGLRFRLRPATPGRGVGVCVCLCARPAWSPAPPGWGCGAGVCAGAWVAASPRHSWLGCWGVCAFVCAACMYPATPGWGVRCGRVCMGSGFNCAPRLLVGASGCVCLRACAPFLPRHSWRGDVCVFGFRFRLLSGLVPAWVLGRVASCVRRVGFPSPSGGVACGVQVCGSCRGWGLSPPLPLFFCFLGLRGGRWFSALSCRGFVVSVACCPGLGSRGLRPPFPSRSGCAFVFSFCPSLPQRGVCWCVWGVLSSGGLLLSVASRRFWLGGPPVFLRGAPWVLSSVPSGWGVCPPLVVWVGGFVAVGVSRAHPPFFWGGGLPVPPSAFPGLVHALVGIRCG